MDAWEQAAVAERVHVLSDYANLPGARGGSSALPPGVPLRDVGVAGTIYLLHFDPPYQHAAHYLGWTRARTKEGVLRRVLRHLRGNGSPLVRAAVRAGCTVQLVRVWRNADRYEERRLKGHASTRYCPICNGQGGRHDH